MITTTVDVNPDLAFIKYVGIETENIAVVTLFDSTRRGSSTALPGLLNPPVWYKIMI